MLFLWPICQIRGLFTKFIWKSKRPRIRRCLRTLSKSIGGVAAPDVFKYHQAAHVGRIIDWCKHRYYKLWMTIEQQFSPVPLSRALWSYATLPASLKLHPTLGPTLRIGSKICRNHMFSSTQLHLFPILGNPGFPPGLELGEFGRLMEKGCFQAPHFLTSGT